VRAKGGYWLPRFPVSEEYKTVRTVGGVGGKGGKKHTRGEWYKKNRTHLYEPAGEQGGQKKKAHCGKREKEKVMRILKSEETKRVVLSGFGKGKKK